MMLSLAKLVAYLSNQPRDITSMLTRFAKWDLFLKANAQPAITQDQDAFAKSTGKEHMP